MRDLSGDLAAAIAAIDRANETDPNLIGDRPLALVQGERASAWLAGLDATPSGELAVAARAHHLRRWEIARADFPEGRDGYLRWRRANKQHQATVIGPLLDGLGFDEAFRARVAALLLRRGLGTDAETQSLEDVACLVFLETQFEPMVDRLDHDHLVRVVAKTLKKMSPEAIALAIGIELSPMAAAVLGEAVTSAAS